MGCGRKGGTIKISGLKSGKIGIDSTPAAGSSRSTERPPVEDYLRHRLRAVGAGCSVSAEPRGSSSDLPGWQGGDIPE